MIKPVIALAMVSLLGACTTPEKPALTAKEQVDGLATMCADNADAMKQRQAEKSLYLRLGGTEGINEFSTRLYASHQKNDEIGHMFENVPAQAFVDNVTKFLVANSGGGGEYAGRTMTEVHKEMGITHQDFLHAGGDVQAVMKGLGAGENEIQEAVCFLVSLVPTVVTK